MLTVGLLKESYLVTSNAILHVKDLYKRFVAKMEMSLKISIIIAKWNRKTVTLEAVSLVNVKSYEDFNNNLFGDSVKVDGSLCFNPKSQMAQILKFSVPKLSNIFAVYILLLYSIIILARNF